MVVCYPFPGLLSRRTSLEDVKGERRDAEAQRARRRGGAGTQRHRGKEGAEAQRHRGIEDAEA